MKSIINNKIRAGQKFGKLTILSRCKEPDKYGQKLYKCKCDCGNITYVRGNRLERGETRSCGCLKYLGNATTHGMSRTALYSRYTSIKSRCYNKHDQAYTNYGARGIVVCDEWKHSFETFYNWAMENGYKEGLTIDRIDHDGNYEPSNCRWVDMKTQQNNKRNNVYLTYNEKTQTAKQWSEELDIKHYLILQRHSRGWTDEECLFGKDNK